jgi:hypothetical protein
MNIDDEIEDESIVVVKCGNYRTIAVKLKGTAKIGDYVTSDGSVDKSNENIIGMITDVIEEPYVDPLRKMARKKLKELDIK